MDKLKRKVVYGTQGQMLGCVDYSRLGENGEDVIYTVHLSETLGVKNIEDNLHMMIGIVRGLHDDLIAEHGECAEEPARPGVEQAAGDER